MPRQPATVRRKLDLLLGASSLMRAEYARALSESSHCTFTVTAAAPANVNVHVFRLLPPLEQAPDQIASRPLVTLSVIARAGGERREPLLPVLTLIPRGDDVTRSPPRPVAVTVSVAV